MNLRRVIRFSVSAVVFLLAATAIGAVFVVADEGFGWDLFPDWLEKCLGVLLASVGVLTGLSLAACLTASAALIALSFANRQGVEEERRLSRAERRALGFAAVAIVALLAGGIAFQKADDWRGRRLEEARRERHRRDYGATRELLERQAAFLAGKISPELARAAADGRKDRDGEIAALLRSFTVSSRFEPSVNLVVRGNPPYLWKRMWPAGGGDGDPAKGGKRKPLGEEPLVDLPSVWERDTVEALFRGAELQVPHGRSGAVLDTKNPCAWCAVRGPDGEICALLVLRNDVQKDLSQER